MRTIDIIMITPTGKISWSQTRENLETLLANYELSPAGIQAVANIIMLDARKLVRTWGKDQIQAAKYNW